MNALPAPSLAPPLVSAFANSAVRPPPLASASSPPCDRLLAIAAGCVDVIDGWSCSVQDVIRLSTLAAELVGLNDSAPQVCLGMAPHAPIVSPALRHAFFAAIVGVQLARGLRLDAVRQLAVAKAALTMNLSALELHDDLATKEAAPSEPQRITLLRHPLLAADLLLDSPGADLRWIEAVEQHHEALDGSGYPRALRGDEICLEARILKLADAWCALIAPRRRNRGAKSPREAIHWLLSRHRQHFDPRLLDALRRLNGSYPPGTLVRLASRETAIVVDLPHGAAPPRRVIAFLGAHGSLYRDPVRRDTGRSHYAIRGYAPLPSAAIAPAYWSSLWQLARIGR